MKAIVEDTYGSADVLAFRDVEVPDIGDDEVLVRVAAAGVDRGAWHFMTGEPYLMRVLGVGFRAPKVRVPGTNVAGRVHAVGRNVTRFRPGDAVYGTCRGAFAEYARADPDKLAPKPTNLSFEQAAVVPYACYAAWQALRDHGDVQPGQEVLVVGASGAVGSFTVQLATTFGARVTGVCSTSNLDFVRSLGAVEVIDYTRRDFADGPGRYDLAIDIGGRTAVSRLRRALNRHGRLVIVGGEGDRWVGGIYRQLWATMLSPFVSQRLGSFVVRENSRYLLDANDLIEKGQVTSILGQTFPLVDAAAAVRYLEVPHAQGRIAITV